MSGHARDPLNPTLDEAAAEVADLVAKFDRNRKHYLSDDYHEAQARIDFINKFLIALGWDVNHDSQEPGTEEVHYEPHDDSHSALSQRTPDYSIAIPPNLKQPVLFVEAKRPSADLSADENYFQVVRYGKNRNHPIGVLTNFSELHVVDCRFEADAATSTACHTATLHLPRLHGPGQVPSHLRPAVQAGHSGRVATAVLRAGYAQAEVTNQGRNCCSNCPTRPLTSTYLQPLTEHEKRLPADLPRGTPCSTQQH